VSSDLSLEDVTTQHAWQLAGCHYIFAFQQDSTQSKHTTDFILSDHNKNINKNY